MHDQRKFESGIGAVISVSSRPEIADRECADKRNLLRSVQVNSAVTITLSLLRTAHLACDLPPPR